MGIRNHSIKTQQYQLNSKGTTLHACHGINTLTHSPMYMKSPTHILVVEESVSQS